MTALDLKVPPPVVALGLALAMWVAARYTPVLDVAGTVRIAVAVAIALVGVVFGASGIAAFRKA